MDKFDEICEKIRNVEIQGATNIAKAAASALLIRNDVKSVRKLLSTRPTEPAMRNAVNYAKKDPKRLVPVVLRHFEESESEIAGYGSKMIKDGMTILTHCHSNSVIRIFEKAKKDGKKFRVFCTETRPLFQGRKTAAELAEMGIPVTMFVDSGARVALKECGLFLFGADAITAEGKVINKIGTELFCETAKRYGVPCYSCTDSWKFDPVTAFGKKEPLERRPESEVWPGAPGGVKILNLAFENVEPSLLAGIISELGVLKPGDFVRKVARAYPSLNPSLK